LSAAAVAAVTAGIRGAELWEDEEKRLDTKCRK